MIRSYHGRDWMWTWRLPHLGWVEVCGWKDWRTGRHVWLGFFRVRREIGSSYRAVGIGGPLWPPRAWTGWQLNPRGERLQRSIADHFQRDHLEGDGPEIDRWKRRGAALEADGLALAKAALLAHLLHEQAVAPKYCTRTCQLAAAFVAAHGGHDA